MSAGTDIKTAAERLNAVAPAIRKRTIEEAKDAEIAELRAALEAAKILPNRLQNWIDVIHDNERSMGDRLQSLSSIFGGLLCGDAFDKYPLQPIWEQKPDSERDAARMGWISVKDQLPEFDWAANRVSMFVHVIVTLDDGRVCAMAYRSNGWTKEESKPTWQYPDGRGILSHHVTHWMPLPPAAISAQQVEAQPLPGDKP